MAQDAELKLKVSLDLGFFRQQLAGLGQAAAGYNIPVQVKFDRRSVQNELNALSSNIRRRNYFLEVKTNLKSEIDNAATLAKALTHLEQLGQKNKGVANRAVTGAGAGTVDATKFQAMINRATKPALENLYAQMAKAKIPMGDVGKGAVNELRAAIMSGVPQITQDIAKGLANGLDPKLKESGAKGAKLFINAFKDASGIASPSKVFKQLGEFSADGLEIGFINGLKEFKQKSLAEIKKIAALMKLELASVGDVRIGAGTGAIRAGVRGGTQYGAPIGPSPIGSREPWGRGTRGMYGGSGFEPYMAGAGRQLPAAFTRIPGISPTTSTASMLGIGLPALPAAGMSSAAGMRQAELFAREAAARARSAERGLAVMQENAIASRVSGQVPLGTPGFMTAPSLPGGPPRGPRRPYLTGGGFGGQGPSGGGEEATNIVNAARNALRYGVALDISRKSLEGFRVSSIPLIGGLKEIGGEFLNATKQVLLYGTAYKGLAFITSLPGQVLNAAKSQQQFNNAMQTATQDTGTFAKEMLYVDNVQRAFGLNLETTRQGFVRLYASMAPTGFDSGSIEKLFTGISAATAALQLTPDKAERVIYAFGQMASKGQIMSEELKGQLGDVLPGALAIFAKAAGMSVKEFSEAMEDGVFVGGKFREVFAKVSDELMNRFGTGAQAAGKSLQGLLNTVGGDFQRTLESFAPLANIAAQAILTPLGNALRQLSISAQIAMGEMERVRGQLDAARQDVSSLRAGGADPSQIKAAEQNVAALEARYRALNEALKDPAVAKQVKDLQLLIQELSKAGTFVMNVAKTIGEILAPALNFLGTNLTSVIATITAFYVGFQTARLFAMALMGVLLLYRGITTALGFGVAAQQAMALAGAFNVLGVAATRATTQMVGLRLALTALVASTVIGAVVGGIVMIAGAFATMSDKAKDAAQSSRDAAKAAIDAAKAGNVAGAAMSVQTVLAESRKAAAARRALEAIYARATPQQKRGAAPMTITSRESVALQGTALTSGMIQAGVSLGGARQIRVPSGPEMRTLRGQFGSLAGQQAIDLRESKEAARQAEEVNRRLGLNKPTPSPAAAAETSESDGASTKKDKNYISQRSDIIRRLGEIEQARINLISNISQEERELLKAAETYRTEDAIAMAKYNEDMAKASEYTGAARARYVQDLKDTLKAEQDLAKGRLDAAVMGPLLQMQESLIRQNYEAVALSEALKQGRTELTEVEKAALQIAIREQAIKKANIPLKDEEKKRLADVNKETLEQAKLNEKVNISNKIEKRIIDLQQEIKLLRARNEEERMRLQIAQENKGATEEDINKIYNLTKVANNIKEARQLIDGFVDSTSSDYKGFLKAVISGEDAVDALEQFQEGLKDRVLTIFLDFTMKPMEDMLKNTFNKIFTDALVPKTALEEGTATKPSTSPVEATDKNTTATDKNTTALDKLTTSLNTPGGGGEQATADIIKGIGPGGLMNPSAINIGNLSGGYGGGEISNIFANSGINLENFTQSSEAFNAATESMSISFQDISETSFGYSESLNQNADNIANATKNAAEGGSNFVETLGGVVQGIGMVATSAMTIVAGIQQVQKGGTKNTLAGIGSILMGVGGGILGFGKLFGANGGVAQGGWKPFPVTPFANGGTVSGPTLGLVGEGKYNEAIVPLPDGRSIPVALQGSPRSRELINGGSERNMSPVLNMSFQTTSVNGVEYVSKDQLEQAMAQTRRLAARDGATKGATMALDKLQQSPSVRRRVGM